MRKLQYIRVPILFPHILCYLITLNKEFIDADLDRFVEAYGFNGGGGSFKRVKQLINVLISCPEFRNLFYTRIAKVSKKYHVGSLLEIILPRYKFFFLGIDEDKVGKGLFILHGNSTIIHAKSIGDNCLVAQNVTIGDSEKGIPEIGNNVKIYTGAVVLGPIKIGDNVTIGANATVVKDLPSNTIVVPSPSYIIYRDGIRVNEKL